MGDSTDEKTQVSGKQGIYEKDVCRVWGILALTFVFGLILMITNLLVDVVYAFLDPRIRY